MNTSILQALIVAIVVVIGGYFSLPFWAVAITCALICIAWGWLNRADETTAHKDADSQISGHTSEHGEKISRAASAIAIGGANVSHFMDKLAAMFKQQVDNVKEIADRIALLEEGNKELIHYASSAQEKMADADHKTQLSNEQLNTMLGQQAVLIEQVEDAKSLLGKLNQSAESIGSITTTINQLADQTNMLALNAAIEAARAGEQGRGFAVVADEVRDLAKKTADATQGIDNVLSEINTCSRNSVDAIEKVATASQAMSEVVTTTSDMIQQSSVSSAEATEAMLHMQDTVKVHNETNGGISTNALQLHENTRSLESDLNDVSEKVLALSHRTEDIFRQLRHFELSNRNRLVQDIAQQAASKIGQLFEQAIAQGTITEQALFDFNYQPVPNTNPQKYQTGFDSFTDKSLPSIQEPILDANHFIIYAGAVDQNGYFPTHNKKFSHPMTGNYEKDLAQSRTKRIFDDYTGSRCGKNTEAFLLQTYKRDTGEVMHDLSAPIYVHNKHWGGFRIGYKAEE